MPQHEDVEHPRPSVSELVDRNRARRERTYTRARAVCTACGRHWTGGFALARGAEHVGSGVCAGPVAGAYVSRMIYRPARQEATP